VNRALIVLALLGAIASFAGAAWLVFQGVEWLRDPAAAAYH
jgi:hypothetical protein